MLISDERPDKIGKNIVDRLSILHLILRIFAFKTEKFVTWRPSAMEAINEGNMTSRLHDRKLRKYQFAYNF